MKNPLTRLTLAAGLAVALAPAGLRAQQREAGTAPPDRRAADRPDGGVPGPIDSLQDLEDTGKMVFKLADSDNDGLISQKEAVDLGNLTVGGFFFRADADGDGKITREEAQQARESLIQKRPWLRYVLSKANQEQRAEGQPNARDALRGIGNLLDSDNDKALEAAEVRQAVQTGVQALYAAADTDRDGQMSPSEVNAAVVGLVDAAAQAMFQAADGDTNGQISQEEFLKALAEPAETAFAVLDKNGDKQLSPEELRSAERVILSQLRALQVPEPANSPSNLIRSGRSPEQAAPVPNIRIPAGTNPNQPAARPAQPAARQPITPRQPR